MADKKAKDYEPEHPEDVLKKKIKYLEEELVRKDRQIEELKKENELLFKTALKNSENKVVQRRYEGNE
jgi:hypothetical protein